MGISKKIMMKALPWIMFLIGFYLLSKFNGLVSGALFVIGIMMLIERRWPEKWGDEVDKGIESKKE